MFEWNALDDDGTELGSIGIQSTSTLRQSSTGEESTDLGDEDGLIQYIQSSDSAETEGQAIMLNEMASQANYPTVRPEILIRGFKDTTATVNTTGELTADDFAVLDRENGWFMHADVWTVQGQFEQGTGLAGLHDEDRASSLPVTYPTLAGTTPLMKMSDVLDKATQTDLL